MAQDSKFKPFVGEYWSEVLSDDKLTLNELKRLGLSKYLRKTKLDLSFYGRNSRLVLRHLTGQAICIWERKLLAPKQYGIKCSLFVNSSQTSSKELFRDAMRLARVCWIEASFFAEIKVNVHPDGFKQLLLDTGWKKKHGTPYYTSHLGSIWEKN